jgi:hypothetical protein
VQFTITKVAVPRRANGPDPEPPLGVHEHESSGDLLCRAATVMTELEHVKVDDTGLAISRDYQPSAQVTGRFVTRAPRSGGSALSERPR